MNLNNKRIFCYYHIPIVSGLLLWISEMYIDNRNSKLANKFVDKVKLAEYLTFLCFSLYYSLKHGYHQLLCSHHYAKLFKKKYWFCCTIWIFLKRKYLQRSDFYNQSFWWHLFCLSLLGERLIQYASENLVTEILIHPQYNTLIQCMRNLLSSFTRHRHIIHAGYTFSGNGSWILQVRRLNF